MRRISAIKSNVTDDELEAIKIKAASLGLSISDFVRQCVLERCGLSVDRVSQLEQRIEELAQLESKVNEMQVILNELADDYWTR